MAITFELPQNIEEHLRQEFGDLSQAAKEAFLIQSYRDTKLSLGQIAEIIGKGVLETDAWLRDRGVPLSYTVEDLEADRKANAELCPES